MPKYFFFDVDGTLLPFGKPMPESAIYAIKAAQVLGNRCLVATGRSRKELPDFPGIDFDGFVLSAGLEVIVDGKQIRNDYMSDDDYRFLSDYLAEHGLYELCQTDDGTYLTKRTLEVFKRHFSRYIGRTVQLNGLLVVDSIPKDIKVRKIVFLSDEDGYGVSRTHEVLMPRYELVKNTVGLPYELMAEVSPKGVTKATGIEVALRSFGASADDAVAIGDGPNDIEMVEYCKVGIAMGNADPLLKEKADWITSDVEEDGIKNAIFHVLAPSFKGA